MKSVEQLQSLSQNPFYKMSEQEKQVLEEAKQQQPIVSSVKIDSKKKESQTSLGSAPVKEIGKLNKQIGDPTTE
jgi:hypothetical protein